jgi:hypothetical protein
MPPDFATLLDEQYRQIAILIFGIVTGMAIERASSKKRGQTWRKRNRWRWEEKRNNIAGPWRRQPNTSKPIDSADQLRIVMGADFTIKRLLNKGEARVFKELDRVVMSCNPGWQVMAQVSLGEILRSKDSAAYGCINSKRVDLLLMDEGCKPRHAIEYHGIAHHQSDAAARDAVKKEALRRAGVGYHEVFAGHTTPSELRLLVEKLVDKPKAA